MYTDIELLEFLPSNRKEFLATAIGHKLIDIDRLFDLDLSHFLEDKRFRTEDFFSYNSGSTQFVFERDLVHVFSVWGEQLSLVVLPNLLASDEFANLHALSTTDQAPLSLKSCLGRTCEDVRIWTLKEDFESPEAKEVAVSYVLSDNLELFYCIYLHEDLSSDYVLTGDLVSKQKVATCFSLKAGAYVDPKLQPFA